MASVVAKIEEIYMVRNVAEKTVIPPRSGVPVVAPSGVEGKVVAVMPKGKFKDNPELLIANSVDEVTEGVVPAWVVNAIEQENKIYLFEGLAEVAECEIIDVNDDDDVVEEGEVSFQKSGFTLPQVEKPPMIYPPPAIGYAIGGRPIVI